MSMQRSDLININPAADYPNMLINFPPVNETPTHNKLLRSGSNSFAPAWDKLPKQQFLYSFIVFVQNIKAELFFFLKA